MRRFLTVIALSACSSYALAQLSADGTAQHMRGVELARSGRYADALEILGALYTAEPDNRSYFNDYLVVLSWSERDDEVIELAEQIDLDAAAGYVLEAIAKSARNTSRYALAIRAYTLARSIDETDIDAHLGLALSLAETGRYEEAEAIISDLPAEWQGEPVVLAATAYIQRLTGQLIGALRTYDDALAARPDDRDVVRGKALVLRDLLLPTQALELATAHPGILTSDEVERLRVDELAVQLRMAADTVYPAALEGKLLDETIAAIDIYLAEAVPDSDAVQALRFDRIAALTERNRAKEAIEAFEELDVPAERMPPYLLAAAGRAYLDIQQPAHALPLLERAASAQPTEIETRLSLIFAYHDLDRYDEAMALTQQTIAEQPLLFSAPDSPVIRGNENRIRAEIMASTADISVDRLAAAQSRLEELLADSPNNTDLRHELANVYRHRGWFDDALSQYDQVLTMDDSQVFAQVGKAHTQLDAQQYRDVESAVESLGERDTPDPVVADLVDRWQTHNRSELLVEAAHSDSSGTTFGANQTNLDVYWFTRPVRYNYRAFVRAHDSQADFPEGDAHRRRLGFGSDYRSNRWYLRGELLRDHDSDELAVTGNATWRVSDYWHVSGTLAFDSIETQLRAHRAGIESDLARLAAEHTPDESSYYRFGLSTVEYSDGNLGETAFGSLSKRILTLPRSITSFIADVTSSRNRLQDVPYFSPRRDLGMSVGATHEWRIRRRYDRLLIQRATVRFGRYDQSGFPAGSVWGARYALEYRPTDTLSIEVGAERSRGFYDGSAEHDSAIVVTVNARL